MAAKALDSRGLQRFGQISGNTIRGNTALTEELLDSLAAIDDRHGALVSLHGLVTKMRRALYPLKPLA
jgi:hypothetical protein